MGRGLRSSALSLAKAFSIGSKSGLWGGRKRSVEPAAYVSLVDRGALVAAEVVHDDGVAWAERRHQHLPDIGKEALTVDRAVDDHGCVDPGEPKARNEGGRAPVAMRDRGV